MILVEQLFNTLKKNKISFFTGVPDSILKNLLGYFNKFNSSKHIIAVNEGAAISIGIGYYLSSKKNSLCKSSKFWFRKCYKPTNFYCQSKSIFNTVIINIGWRGSPNKEDEPQHIGKITTQLLKLLDINYCVLKDKKRLSTV